MTVPDLWLLISSLEGPERTRLRKFLASPYFNSDAKHVELFEAVYEQVQEGRCDREALDAIIFPYQPFAYTRITNLISDLKKLIESFFVQEELKRQEFQWEHLAMQTMKKRGLAKSFQQSTDRIKKAQKGQPSQSELDFLQRYLTEEEEYQFYLRTEGNANPRRIGKKIKSLHLFYVLAMLKSVCQDLEQQAEKGTFLKNSHRVFIQYMLENQKLYEHELLLRLYIRILHILLNPTEINAFELLIQELISSKNELPKARFWRLFQYAHSHSLRVLQKEKDNREVKHHAFTLYCTLIEEDWTISEGFLSVEAGKHIVLTGIELGKIEETEAFINRYAKHANTIQKKTALAFFRAYFLARVENKKKAALEILETNALEHSPFYTETIFLLSTIYYELYEDEAMMSLWRDFIHQLKKDKNLPAKERGIYIGLKKAVEKLQKLRTQANISQPAVFEKKRLKLETEIKSMLNTSLAFWILEEVQELRKG